MYRKFYDTLTQWEKSGHAKPLLITGVRQSGKTWLLQQFCTETYNDYIYVNLEEQQDMRSIFDGNLEPSLIIRQMEQLLGRRIGADTPVIFDEVQSSERAITSMKYFCEAEENYRILCAGSLLGVKIARFQSSFPVGKVEIKNLYPMDFEEFLKAADEDLLLEGIRDAFTNRRPLADGIHQKALRLYHDYLFTGGMPEAVLSYIKNGKSAVGLDESFYRTLQLSYLADMSKYVKSPAESIKISEVYNSIPRQLAKENPKFKYNEVRARANRRDFAGPVNWLSASGMINRINSVELPKEPLKGYENSSSFKIYLSDTGLLTHLCGMKYRNLLPEADNMYKGGIIENYVVQQLLLRHPDLYYYKPSDTLEVDLLFDSSEGIVPVEIKSGRHKRSTSLNNYCAKYKPPYSIRFSELNFGRTDTIFSVPLYAAFCV